MNKKFLFAAMSLAALTACTNDDFDSQNVAEEAGLVQFEVINDGVTRASMDGNTIVWNAKEGDIFTLYHGAALEAVTGYQNATFKANEGVNGGKATLSSPSMILQGGAIMVWPADTTFRIKAADKLTITIPAAQDNIENNIPYVSDQVQIVARDVDDFTGSYNEAGYNRAYPVYMRPMASQLNIKADYAGTDATLASLYSGEDGIDKINVTSIELSTDDGGADLFTTEIPVEFTAANAAWTDAKQLAWHSNWKKVTNFKKADIAAAGQTDKLTTKCLTKDAQGKAIGCKFLILPQKADIAGGVDEGAVVVKTNYGDVIVADPGVAGSLYEAGEAADAWYRYIKPATAAEAYEVKAAAAETSGDNQGKHKTTTSIANGLMQTLNVFSNYEAPASLDKIVGEPMGTAATRYVKVLLTHLDMTNLHITSDKQLRDVVRVWEKMGLGAVTVYLDGDKTNHEFTISQKTIETINAKNGNTLNFKVKPCRKAHVDGVDDEFCDKIVITGGGDVNDIAFIADNAGTKVPVELEAGKTWNWKGTVKIGDGVSKMINRGTMANALTANATLKTQDKTGTQNNIPFENAKGAKWNVSGNFDLTVQFNVTNFGEVNIAKGAEYHQDIVGDDETTFINQATAVPSRFTFAEAHDDAQIGVVVNKGVFAVTGTTAKKGIINNYGLIKHDDNDAKTYITSNRLGGVFHNAFGGANKMGMISLPWGNKDEENISVSAALEQGFIAVTVNGEVTGALDAEQLGTKINYLIVNAGPTSIANVADQVKYLEIAMTDKSELAWSTNQAFEGLIVLSPVNIQLDKTITVNATGSTYLGAKMYVGGIFTNNGGWSGYYGNTTANVTSMYITYGE